MQPEAVMASRIAVAVAKRRTTSASPTRNPSLELRQSVFLSNQQVLGAQPVRRFGVGLRGLEWLSRETSRVNGEDIPPSRSHLRQCRREIPDRWSDAVLNTGWTLWGRYVRFLVSQNAGWLVTTKVRSHIAVRAFSEFGLDVGAVFPFESKAIYEVPWRLRS
jgi:hypothetical protein